MSLLFRIDHRARLIVAAGHGTLTDEEVFGYERQIAARADTSGYDELVDMSHVTRIALPSTKRVEELAAEAAATDATRERSKLAIVAPGDLAYGLGRMFQTRRSLELRATKDVGVFRTMDEALAFLGLDHAQEMPAPD